MVLTDNPTVYKCPQRALWFPEPGAQLSYIHAFVMVVKDQEDFPWMQIEVPPYTIVVTKSKDSAKSVIKKTVRKKKSKYDKSKNKEYEYKEIIEIDEAVELPWNDRPKVIDRIHTYLVFS